MEIEAKFHVQDLALMKKRLLRIGGKSLGSPQHEINWRFDREDRELTKTGQVLRIRQDNLYRITYKAPGPDGIHREEIEFQVNDLQEAQAFLAALGYHPIMIYEKYRETYVLPPVEVMLDQLPFGAFVEIEGPSEEDLKMATKKLGLKWEAYIPASYLDIFFTLRENLDLPFPDATFENFKGQPVNLPSMGFEDARLEEDKP
jgi:adenylate cyclase class 2